MTVIFKLTLIISILAFSKGQESTLELVHVVSNNYINYFIIKHLDLKNKMI